MTIDPTTFFYTAIPTLLVCLFSVVGNQSPAWRTFLAIVVTAAITSVGIAAGYAILPAVTAFVAGALTYHWFKVVTFP